MNLLEIPADVRSDATVLDGTTLSISLHVTVGILIDNPFIGKTYTPLILVLYRFFKSRDLLHALSVFAGTHLQCALWKNAPEEHS